MSHPLDQFKIKKYIDLNLWGVDISFTNSSLFMLISVAFICLFMTGAFQKEYKDTPPRWKSAVELIYSFIRNMITDNCGEAGLRYFPFVMSIFLIIAMGNLVGMLPHTFTFTSHIAVTFTLASIVFIGVTIIGIIKHRTGYLRILLPEGAPLFLSPILIPIELISYLSRPVSLSVRLFANIMAGHMVLKIFAGFIVSLGVLGGWLPLGMTVILTFFEVFVALIQAYIFAILTCVYLNDALHLH